MQVNSDFKKAYVAALESTPAEFEDRLNEISTLVADSLARADLRFWLRLGQAAYIMPEKSLEITDSAIAEWQGQPVQPEITPRPMPAALQEYVWNMLERPAVDTDAVVRSTTQLEESLGDELRQAYLTSISQRPGVQQAFEEGFRRPTMTLEDLNGSAPGTLGYVFYHQLADNGLLLEIVAGYQRPKTGLALLDYVNERMPETHDLRHVVLGYSTNAIDEGLLQGFEAAQVGRTFSTSLLALGTTLAVLGDPARLNPQLHMIVKGWQRGRQTTPLLPVHWEEQWGRPLDEVRADLGIKIPAISASQG